MSRAMENNAHEKKPYTSEPSLCSDESSTFGNSLDPLVNKTTCEELNTKLIESIPGGDITYMKRILAMGANPNASCRLDHVSACHIAAMFDNVALDMLLRSGADSSRSDKHGRTPLHLAAWTGNMKHIAVLLNFPKAIRQRVAYQVVLSPEIVAEVKRHSLPVNKLINLPCRPNVESTPAGDWSEGVEHNCDSIKEMLPLFEQEWTALHAASARAQHYCVQLLLAAGADASAQDLLYRTALDVAGCAYYLGHKIDVNNFTKTVDLLLKAGGKFQRCYNRLNCLSTPLHTAVELRSKAAVEQILQGGASATVWDHLGRSAMHVCAYNQDEELLQLLVNHGSSNEESNLASIDVVDRMGYTVLARAVQAEWSPGVRIAAAAGAANLKFVEPGSNFERTVFYEAASHSSKDVLENLLNYYDHEEVNRHINTSDCLGTLLYYAIHGNNVDCARLLIGKGAEVNRVGHNSLLHLAVCTNNTRIAEMIIEKDIKTVHGVNYEGRSPLYQACSHGHREMIALLLRHGADLSGGENNNGRKFVPIEILMHNFSKPTEFMQDIFDSNIDSYFQKKDYDEVFVNFEVLLPYQRKKMNVIQALLNTGNKHDQQKLLLHPLVESFLFLQWKSSLPFFYIILALHVCFLLSLNVFAISLFWYTDRKIEHVPIVFRSGVWIYMIYLAAFFLTVQEVVVIQMKTIRYRLCLETSVKCLSTILAVVLPQVVSWDSKSNPEWVRLFGSVTLLLAWVRMMYLLSRLPDCGYYVLMYGKVAIKVFKILASFGFLIVGFSVSFMIHFHAQQPFEDFWSSLLTTMVMMTSELGYNEIINKKSVEHTPAYIIMIRLIFVSFLILVSIILMNLLVGVAVNDVNTLEIIGNINRLKKQVQFIESFEDAVCYHFIAKTLPGSLKRWFAAKTPRAICVRKRQTRNGNHGLPTRLIEAIFENVQLQKRKSYEKLSTKLYQTKLDEIHKVIVKKENGIPAKPEIPDNAKLFEEINKLRTDMELLKTISVKIATALNVVISHPNQR